MRQIQTVTSLVDMISTSGRLCNKLYYFMIELYTKLTIHYHLHVIPVLQKKQPCIILLISHVWCDLALLKSWQYAENVMMWRSDFELSILLPSYGDYLLTLPLNQGMDAAALLRSWEKKKRLTLSWRKAVEIWNVNTFRFSSLMSTNCCAHTHHNLHNMKHCSLSTVQHLG